MQAFPPIALGHATAVLIAVLLIWVAEIVVPLYVVRYACALIIFGSGFINSMKLSRTSGLARHRSTNGS